MSEYILIKKIRIQNANAISSPFTFGFPAITAFMGFAHKIQRHFNPDANPKDLLVNGTGIIHHQFSMQSYKNKLKLTANPLEKDGSRPSFVEEGRCHLTLSLLLEVENLPIHEKEIEQFKVDIVNFISLCKLAGGDIITIGNGNQKSIEILEDKKSNFYHFMPGYFLMENRKLMTEAMEDGQDALDALYHYLKINYRCNQNNNGDIEWHSYKHHSGWLAPIATGFYGISRPEYNVKNKRDIQTIHRFAESLITLGEFVMPHRIENLSDTIWRYQYLNDCYACMQVQK